MKQRLVEKNNLDNFFDLYIIFIKRHSRREIKDINEIKKQYDQLISLNPKYPEHLIPLKQAILKVQSSDIIYSSKYNFFSTY